MEKRAYVKAEAEIILLRQADLITTSGGPVTDSEKGDNMDYVDDKGWD